MSRTEDYRNTLNTLFKFDDWIELRLIRLNREIEAFQGELTEESLEKFVKLIEMSDSKYRVEVTLNPLMSQDQIEAYARDNMIDYRRYILIDVDPVKTSSSIATDENKVLCHKAVLQIRQYLTESGFCEPLLADSGNSYHLIYYIGNIPNTTENTNLIRAFLNALKSKFASDYAIVDIATANAGRLVKVYGTHSMKEPFRLSRILEIPNDWRVAIVTQEQLQSIVAENFSEKIYSVDSFGKMKPRKLIEQETRAVLNLLKERGVTVQSSQDLDDGGKKFSLNGCPFEKPNSTRQVSCLFINKSGKMSLSCRHDSCYVYDLQSFLLNQVKLNEKIITNTEE